MNEIAIIYSLLRTPAIQAIVGERIALDHLSAGETLPGIAFSTVSTNAVKQSTGHYYQSRIQVNPIGYTMAEVQNLGELIKTALHQKTAVMIDGSHVISIGIDTLGAWDVADDVSPTIYTRSIDFQMLWRPATA